MRSQDQIGDADPETVGRGRARVVRLDRSAVRSAAGDGDEGVVVTGIDFQRAVVITIDVEFHAACRLRGRRELIDQLEPTGLSNDRNRLIRRIRGQRPCDRTGRGVQTNIHVECDLVVRPSEVDGRHT